MKNIEEAVNVHILEKNMETANGEEAGAIFETALTQEDLNSPDFPTELKQEILYVRAKLANSEITTTPVDYNAGDLTTADLFFVDSSVAEGKEKAYVYDEQSKSIFKAKPTIISGKSMFGHDYGKIIGVQGLLTQPTQTVETGNWNGTVNAPKIAGTGLIPVTITETGENVGAITEVEENTTGWYDYIAQTGTTETGGTSKWANAITKNDSNQITGMFVWIPRFAYKITSGFHKSWNELGEGKTSGTIDVVFLKGTTDKYEVNGVEYTAKRLSEEGIDTDNPSYYVVHPCFTKTEVAGVKTYDQGEWDEELEGIWIAKFDAGYAGGSRNDGNGNTVEIRSSDITYGANCTTNYYGTPTPNSTLIPYPVFLPKTYCINNITISDIFRISRKIANGNTYYNLNNTDSHMMKNSEWGAVAYLTQSKYGRNGTEIAVNDITKNNSPSTIYGVTGYSSGTTTAINTSISSSYEWTTNLGKKASSTGNVYGIYDLSGGTWEYVAGYILNTDGSSSRSNYGKELAYNTDNIATVNSDKYRTIYASQNNAGNSSTNYNLDANKTKRGDSIWETSSAADSGVTNSNISSWNADYTLFPYYQYPFFTRGGSFDFESATGTFTFCYFYGQTYYNCGFRAVLI